MKRVSKHARPDVTERPTSSLLANSRSGRASSTTTQTLSGEPIYVAGPSHTSTVFGTTTLPSGTVIVTGPSVTSVTTLPAETVRETVTQTLPAETVTETVHDTSTVTETVHDTVTEVVTETVTAPSP